MVRHIAKSLEEELTERLPDWIEMEPQRWQQLQIILRRSESSGPDFATFEAFIEWVDEDTSAEWDDGEVVFKRSASTQHQLITGWLYTLLSLYVEERKLGVLLGAPYKMKLPGYGAEPDLLFVRQEHAERIQETFLDGPADLVVEVVSPSSVERDRGKKFVAYEAAGVPEFWLIDPQRQQAEFYRLDENGRYHPTPLDDNGRYPSAVLPGFWLDPTWLWQQPLPAVLTLLREMGVSI